MNRTQLLSIVAVCGSAGVLLASSAQSQLGQPKNSVTLQPVTPGVSQSGHANLSGTLKASQFQGSGAGLTNLDASQIVTGTISSGRLPLPLQLTGSDSVGVIRASNSSSTGGSAAVVGVNTAPSSTSIGVLGRVFSTNGTGVYGEATALSGDTWGVLGWSQSATGGGGVIGIVNSGNSDTSGVLGQGNGVGSNGVRGISASTTGGGAGVLGEGPNLGVKGIAQSTSGSGFGGYFQTNSPNGNGVYCLANSSTGQSYGGFFQNMSSAGYAIWAANYSGSGATHGLYGLVSSPNGIAVRGEAPASTGPSVGGHFTTFSSSGTGVRAMANSFSGASYGVYSINQSTGGYAGWFTGVGPDSLFVENTGNGRGIQVSTNSDTAIWARATNAFAGIDARNSTTSFYAVFGNAPATTGTAVGVMGQTNSATGWGLFSIGNSGASGTKSFRIDHPFDPENKYLLHYSTEMPEPQNAYNGVIVTGKDGYAWVELPDYFGAINRDFRYQLTVVDSSDDFIMAKVTKEIENNHFQIRTSQPNVKVSWEIKAIRNDAWMKAHRAPTEIEKPEAERGKYQHPDLYGQPKERSITFRSLDAEHVKRRNSR